MDNRKTKNSFQRLWTQRRCDDGDQTGSRKKPDGFTSESRILDMERAERAERAVMIQQIERVCAVAKARKDAILKRLGLSGKHDATPSPQPPAFPRGNPKSSLRGGRLTPLLHPPHLNTEGMHRNQRSPESLEDDSSWDSVAFGGRMAATARKEAQVAVGDESPTPSIRSVSSLSSIETRTPTELRDIPLIGSPVEVQTFRPAPPRAVPPKRSKVKCLICPVKASSGAGKKTISDHSLQTANNKKVVELQPLYNPEESLSLFFKLLSSDDCTKKMDSLKTMQALAQHHSETLQTKLHEVCLVLIEEVKNLRSAVACAAMTTVAELYVHLQKAMDPEVEGTGQALLLKLAQSTNNFIHQQANVALDAMVQNCSYGRIVSALLNTGLSHRCVAVRGSTAQHLHQLAERFGAAHILTAAGRSFTERFLIAVSKMSVDAPPEVRHHGQAMVQELALHKEFLNLWTKIVPERERRSLDKILKKAK